MKRTAFIRACAAVLVSALLLTALCGCGAKEEPAKPDGPAVTVTPLETPSQPAAAEAPATTEPPAPPETETVPARQDGERFEAVIILEGMEEPVQYEHIRNETLGFEMDYDYALFERRSGADRECIVSVYDGAAEPEDYLEVTRRAEDAETAAASIGAALSETYEISRSPFTLERAGEVIRIDASADKGGLTMPDRLQMVYIIPADEGCLVAIAHYSIEGAEGLGRRFAYMMHTFSPIAQSR